MVAMMVEEAAGQEVDGRGRGKGRTAVCTGGCGRTIHRCRRENPVCSRCEINNRKPRERGPSLDAPQQSDRVNVRSLRVEEMYATVWHGGLRRAFRLFRKRHGRRPTGRECRRMERRFLWVMDYYQMPTSITNLPNSFQHDSFQAIRWKVVGEDLPTVSRLAAAFASRIPTKDCHVSPDRQSPDTGRTSERAAGVARRRHAVVGGRGAGR